MWGVGCLCAFVSLIMCLGVQHSLERGRGSIRMLGALFAGGGVSLRLVCGCAVENKEEA